MPIESEAETRKRRVDTRLKALGWTVAPFAPNRTYARHAVEEYPTQNGPADYALVVNGRVLGIIEAKRLTLGPQNVLTQAERYSRGFSDSSLNFSGLRVPFLYSTNGEVLWFRDARDDRNLSRRISTFHTPDALDEMMQRDFQSACARLATPNNHPRLRNYQIAANTAIEQAVAARKRQMLVAMATGCGKTFLTVNEVYRLMKSGVARRVLFLVDRKALAAQAVRSFASFEPEPGLKFDKVYEVYSQRLAQDDEDEERFDPKVLPAAYLQRPNIGLAFVYVCTIQRMAINLFGRNAVTVPGEETLDDDDVQLDIPIHAFDAIIADECHRGYTSAELSVWRNTLDHFDAIKIGLTATPAAHTKAYFNDVVFRYTYEQAVRDGHLVDFDAVSIRSDVKVNGVFLLEGETVGVVNADTGAEQLDLLEDKRHFEPPEIEEKVTSPDSNKLIVEEIKKYALEHEARYGRFPKTLIFAANDLPHISHADQLVKTCREVFGRGESFVQKITGRVDEPLKRIREFRNRPAPGIVVTVDMLSTGVDIPDLEFIVFLRQVKSRILWEQMLGRGTRKGEKFRDKSHFTVFDCFDGTLLAYFKNASAMNTEPPDKPSRTIVQIIDDVWQNRDRDYNVRLLVKRLQRIDKEMSGKARELFAAHVPGGDLARYARELPGRLADDFTGTMALLRNPAFQELLQNYPRPPRTFTVAYETEDAVTSEVLIRDGAGNEYKPEDYLEAFATFVKENPAHVEAIRILLGRPQEWNTQALTELRRKLAATQERFTEDNLRRAHAIQYHKALVDIISMVKHAAKEQEPLLTAAERVDRAFARLLAGRHPDEQQQKWLERIRAHLVENLSIERDDFDDVPIFAREGGWAQADKAFKGKLENLVRELNREIAA
ncbi:MAG TPA: type I restriction-modification enzyme R subunit C-terminal domain-containing protein [Planctomycetota bacterium]|jgi:type I restriction enzyme R subunit